MSKNSGKISLGTVICIFIILLLVLAIAYMAYYNKQQKADNERTISQLNTQVKSLENTVNNVKTAINNSTVEEKVEYKELTSSLDNKDVLFVTKAIKNIDNTYTLYGVIYTCNENANPEYQLTDSWTVSNEYRKITISSNTECTGGYPEEKDTTVGEYFKNYKEVKVENSEQPADINTYRFVFENGKCTKVIDYCTAI